MHHPEIIRFCENFAVIPASVPEYIVLSCDPSRRDWNRLRKTVHNASVPSGELYIWRFTHPESLPIRLYLPDTVGKDFHPLGIGAAVSSNEEKNSESGEDTVRLFIANQALSPQLTILNLRPSTLGVEHVSNVRHPRIRSPNGVAAFSYNGAFVTNDGRFTRVSQILWMVEYLFSISLADVIYVSLPPPGFAEVDTSGEITAASENWNKRSSINVQLITTLPVANGIAIASNDFATPEIEKGSEHTLYIASMTSGIYVYTFTQHQSQNSITSVVQRSLVKTPFWPDNILYESGSLYVSGHPHMPKLFAKVEDDHAEMPPSWTVRLRNAPLALDRNHSGSQTHDLASSTLGKSEAARWESVFGDDGSFAGSISTGGVLVPGIYVAAGLWDRGIVRCQT